MEDMTQGLTLFGNATTETYRPLGEVGQHCNSNSAACCFERAGADGAEGPTVSVFSFSSASRRP